MVEQWEVYQADLDPTVGHEQQGRRPVLVLSSEEFNRRAPMVIVAPMTTPRPGRKVYPAEATVAAGLAGQPNDSIVLIHQVRALDRRRLGRRYGCLDDPAARGAVAKALDFAFGDVLWSDL